MREAQREEGVGRGGGEGGEGVRGVVGEFGVGVRGQDEVVEGGVVEARCEAAVEGAPEIADGGGGGEGQAEGFGKAQAVEACDEHVDVVAGIHGGFVVGHAVDQVNVAFLGQELVFGVGEMGVNFRLFVVCRLMKLSQSAKRCKADVVDGGNIEGSWGQGGLSQSQTHLGKLTRPRLCRDSCARTSHGEPIFQP